MYQFIETIKIEKNVLHNINGHNKRLNETRKHFFGITKPLFLQDIINVPKNLKMTRIIKCRIVYDIDIKKIEYIEYIPKSIINLKLVDAEHLIYNYKYKERKPLEILVNRYREYSDILIVQNGFITDTSFANVIFYDGSKWITPDTYILNGTKRQLLLKEKKIIQRTISVRDVKRFQYISLINSMLEPWDLYIKIKDIY